MPTGEAKAGVHITAGDAACCQLLCVTACDAYKITFANPQSRFTTVCNHRGKKQRKCLVFVGSFFAYLLYHLHSYARI